MYKRYNFRVVADNYETEVRKVSEILTYLSNYIYRGVTIEKVEIQNTLTVQFLVKESDCNWLIGMQSRFPKCELKEEL